MNTALGYNADVSSPSLTNATAIGANIVASQSNSMILGNGADVGIGTSSPSTRLVVAGGNMILRDQTDVVDAVELASGTGAGASGSIGIRNSGINTVFLTGTGSSWFNAGRLGVGTNSPLERFHVFEQTNLDVLFESATGLADFTIDAAVNRADIIFKRSGATEGSIGYNLTNDYLFLNDGVESLISRNGDIGIGTTTPTEKLEVVGDVKAQNFQYSAPKTRHLTIGEADFRMTRSWAGDIESTFGMGGVGIVNSTGSNALVAPVYLPQGAVVTNIEVFYVDNSTANMDISFDRRGLTGGLSVISSASTSTNSTIVNTLNLTGTNIDNANNSYNIRVFSSGWSTNTTKTMDIRTIKITYTITETD